MSSPNHLFHRRRSHSASSPIPRRHQDDVKWCISNKRSRPSSIRGPSYKDLAQDQPEKWDVDQWRRGKRARRESSPAEDSFDEMPGLVDPIPSPGQSPVFGIPSTSRLPCSSAAFQFFPRSSRREPQAYSRRARLSREASPREGEQMSSHEARRMRADALGALHRSVAETGEALVRRMRDWERSRKRPARPERESIPTSGSATSMPRRSSYYGIPRVAEAIEEEDDVDVFMVGETSLFSASHSPTHKKRALSLSTMDVDMVTLPSPFADLGESERSSSPIDAPSAASAYSDDDDVQLDMDTDLSSSGLFSTPALSHTHSTSNNSSVISLPLSSQAGESSNAAITSITATPGRSPPTFILSPASRSDKAIAALTLAMANGAAGITGYDSLRMAEELTTLDASHAGELWS